MTDSKDAIVFSLKVLQFTELVLTQIRNSCGQALAGSRTIAAADVEQLRKECEESIEKIQQIYTSCHQSAAAAQQTTMAQQPSPPRVM